MAALTGPPRSRLWTTLHPGYPSTSSSVVANLLRCKLDCINRRDTRSVHPSVDDPSAVCVRSSAARAPAASSTPPSTEPYHPILLGPRTLS
ncbi:hypothetical protein EVAR_32533_1 [Eumeta japonica]|uniref:Uncharacterized protein n=1 Tax=Eumeta variegata TaxID=151549 RepID=A0A4C1WA54_EUMVA|nr:hypothetical protein EVAR_32533_1 [Eumeta japonica]